MKTLHTTIRHIGNSQGVVIPKTVLAQLGFDGTVDMTVEADALVLRKSQAPVRAGWAEAAKVLSAQGGDLLVMGEFGNEEDQGLVW
jgi:antitoxin MazE